MIQENTEKLINHRSLKDHDPEIYNIIKKEEERQITGLELIASENYTSRAVMDCMGSCLTNKYSEGQVGARYYGGIENIDEIESLCKSRALKAFGLEEKDWGVNVQPYSGSPANFAVYTGILKPGDKLMGLDLPSGGHLTHGYQTETRIISSSSYYFKTKPYKVNMDSGLFDYAQIKKDVLEFKPDLLICGFSAYSRDIDYKQFREAADSVGAYLMADIAHISGFVASKLLNNPFEYCDIVTSTTHKTLRGPRSGIIFYKMDERKLKEKIDFAVFPMLQGGPHNVNIAGVATQLKEVMTEDFKDYCKQIIKNSKALAAYLMSKGHKIATDGTDNHLFLLDMRPHGLSGGKGQTAFDMVKITTNKNSIVGDKR
jgi:glycine hydroxymethyltransferase